MLTSLLVSALLLCTSAADAGVFEVTLDEARLKMSEGDVTTAAGLVRAAELYAPDAPDLIAGAQLGRIWMYRGMFIHMQGDQDEAAMIMWRQALTLDPELEWDSVAYPDKDGQRLFEALRAEVRSRPQVDTQAPEATGEAKLYADGQRVRSGDTVRQGIHLLQVQCPGEQGTHGEWNDLAKKFKWLQLCPEGVDTTVVVEEEDPDGDEFGDFGPMFGGDGPATADTTVYEPLPPAPLPEPRKKVNKPLLASAGVALLASGGMYLAALNSRSQFDDLTNPELTNAQAVSDLRQQTNTRVYISAGVGVAAVGLYTAAWISF